MHDRPTPPELLAATRTFLEKELLPSLTDPRLRFQTLIAANVLAIVERELNTEEADLRAEWQMLDLPAPAPDNRDDLRQQVRAAEQALCHRIRTGDFDAPEPRQALLQRLRQLVEQKLAIANPGQAGKPGRSA